MTQKISDEERQFFRDAVSHVKPLKQTQLTNIQIDTPKKPEKIAPKKITLKPRTVFPEEKPHYLFNAQQPDIKGDTVIAYAKSGLQHKRTNQLRQGKMRIEATLDLHEHTSDEAMHATDNFLMQCKHNHFRTVCIIHGKGIYSSDNKPVLKNLLNNYLRQHPLVLAFHSASNKHGGTGALIIIIKA